MSPTFFRPHVHWKCKIFICPSFFVHHQKYLRSKGQKCCVTMCWVGARHEHADALHSCRLQGLSIYLQLTPDHSNLSNMTHQPKLDTAFVFLLLEIFRTSNNGDCSLKADRFHGISWRSTMGRIEQHRTNQGHQ